MDPDTLPTPRLSIESGLHRDASSPIPPGETRVGAAFDADVGVSDIAVPFAFTLRRQGGSLVVRADDAPLALAGKRLRPGQARACRTSSTLTSGPIRFRLEIPEPQSPKPSRGGARWQPMTGAFAAGAVCLPTRRELRGARITKEFDA